MHTIRVKITNGTESILAGGEIIRNKLNPGKRGTPRFSVGKKNCYIGGGEHLRQCGLSYRGYRC